MKLGCSKCKHVSEQTVNWFEGLHHQYVCENEPCGVLLQGDFNAATSPSGGVVSVGVRSIVACEHPDRMDPEAHLFYDAELLEEARKGATGFRERKE